MTRLILDAMGGDFGPRVILEGVVQALPHLLKSSGELVIVGNQDVIQSLLKKRRYQSLAKAIHSDSNSTNIPSPFRISLLHTSEAIQMKESISAVRAKPEASINLGCQLAGKSYTSGASGFNPQDNSRPAAFVSAGHSGAIMASSLLHIGRLSGVERPAIAIKLPTLGPDGCVLIDAGANVDCKAEHLRDFAVMGSIYAQIERKSSSLPRVALLSNGEEKSKGNDLIRTAYQLLEATPQLQASPHSIGKFVGYGEGKEIFKGQVDVIVTDGFVGNVVLKSLEGLGSSVITILKQEAKRNPFTSLGFLLAAGVFARFKQKLDYAEYGAAPLLGVAGYVFICHGRSNSKAIKNALLRAQAALKGQLVEKLEAALQESSGRNP
jgi:glycerol-3-phosphate acyltransferase PlsX